jgi:ABC-type transport system involved in multi-copper enzyme maturation permease subunit
MEYARFIWRNNRGFLAFALIVVALFQFLLLRVVTGLEISPMISSLVEGMPANVRRMIGQEALSMLTVEGAAAFGFNHPLVLVIMAIAAITIPARHIAGEVENGTLELLLSFPLERVRLLLQLFASGALFLLLIALLALASSLGSIAFFHRLSADTALTLAGIACNLWLLFTLVASLALLLSSFGREANKVALRAAGATLVFYLLHYLSSMWEAIAFTKPFNIFTYFQPTALMSGQRSLGLHAAVLSVLIVVLLAASAFQFSRRDVP